MKQSDDSFDSDLWFLNT